MKKKGYSRTQLYKDLLKKDDESKIKLTYTALRRLYDRDPGNIKPDRQTAIRFFNWGVQNKRNFKLFEGVLYTAYRTSKNINIITNRRDTKKVFHVRQIGHDFSLGELKSWNKKLYKDYDIDRIKKSNWGRQESMNYTSEKLRWRVNMDKLTEKEKEELVMEEDFSENMENVRNQLSVLFKKLEDIQANIEKTPVFDPVDTEDEGNNKDQYKSFNLPRQLKSGFNKVLNKIDDIQNKFKGTKYEDVLLDIKLEIEGASGALHRNELEWKYDSDLIKGFISQTYDRLYDIKDSSEVKYTKIKKDLARRFNGRIKE